MTNTGTPATSSPRRASSLRREEAFWGFMLMLPSTIGIIVFALVPIAGSLGVSFTDWGGLSAPNWIGLENYQEAMQDEKAINSIIRTLIFTIMAVPLGLVASLAIATLIHNLIEDRSKTIFRTLYYLPMVTIGVATALLWRVLFTGQSPINAPWLLLGLDPPAWLSDPNLVLVAVAIYSVWQGAGSSIILFLAALANVPKELYEAAQLDGARGWDLFRHITVPNISPTIFLVLILSLIGGLQVFDAVLVMPTPGGGPGESSTTIALYIYKVAFKFFKMGYATSLAWLLSGALILLMFWQWRLQRAWVHYD
jgi:multiple sugar transport system permease protein